MAAACRQPWRPHGGRHGGRHRGRHGALIAAAMAAAVATAGWPPHGIPIGYGSRVGIRAMNPESQFNQLDA